MRMELEGLGGTAAARGIEGGLGPRVTRNGVEYAVWAPKHRAVEVVLLGDGERILRSVPLERLESGWFGGVDRAGKAGDLYKFRLGGKEMYPDMLSHFQPRGVHGASEVVDHGAFAWPEAEGRWKNPAVTELVIYECHVGTFTTEGTFRAAVERLGHVKEVGATAIQLMPVADFAGARNWGYDMVSLFASSRSYGRPEDLKALVAAAHQHGLAVILDVVYNHFGPDGNYWEAYAEEFFAKGANIWGKDINFAEEAARRIFVGNVIHWMENYHVDGFRLDATHAIKDDRRPHVLTEIAEAVRERGGFTIAEDERNWSELVKREGVGIDAVWADDFHHVVKVALTGERFAHFVSYEGTAGELLDTVRNGWLFRGQTYKQTGKKRGTECADLEPGKLIYCISNHDQAGNRPLGERLNHLVSADAYNAAAALLCVLPYTPMIFMGQEFAATTGFCFFTDHAGEIGRNVSKGRLNEFKHYKADFSEGVLNRMPDPQVEKTFLDSKLSWDDLDRAEGRRALETHRKFFEFRRARLTEDLRRRGSWRAELMGETLAIFYGEDLLVLADFKGGARAPRGWREVLASGDFGGARTVIFEKI